MGQLTVKHFVWVTGEHVCEIPGKHVGQVTSEHFCLITGEHVAQVIWEHVGQVTGEYVGQNTDSKKPLQKKSKELENMYWNAIYICISWYNKVCWFSENISRIQGVCHMIYIYFWTF